MTSGTCFEQAWKRQSHFDNGGVKRGPTLEISAVFQASRFGLAGSLYNTRGKLRLKLTSYE